MRPLRRAPQNGSHPYEAHVDGFLSSQEDRTHALQLAIGGDSPQSFAAIGSMQRDLLAWYGLRQDSSLVDVECGSGRLAVHLVDWLLRGSYLGIDVVQQLLDHAAVIAGTLGIRGHHRARPLDIHRSARPKVFNQALSAQVEPILPPTRATPHPHLADGAGTKGQDG